MSVGYRLAQDAGRLAVSPDIKSDSGGVVRSMKSGEACLCEAILRSLPDWFGLEDAIVQYRVDIETMQTIVSVHSEVIVGFLTVREHNPKTAEIQVMAVMERSHGRGGGRDLVRAAEWTLRQRSFEFLQVKTLGPSRPCAAYEKTHRFYEALGFTPLEENNLWGPANPCLILVKHLACDRASH